MRTIFLILAAWGLSPVLESAERPFIGPYLQALAPTSVVVKWQTDDPSEGAVEVWGAGGRRRLREETSRSLHSVLVDGLEPGTRYAYRILWEGREGEEHSFHTMPPPGASKLRIAAYGDSRSNPAVHERIAAAMLALDPDVVLNTGDLVTDGRQKDQWKPQFFDPLHALMATRPVITCMGNHEKDSGLYYDYFEYPGNEAWFSYRWANVHFIVLDSQKPFEAGTPQFAWLEAELAEPRPQWRIVFFHYPMFSCHPTREVQGNRWAWQDLFDRGGVDLVLTGHDHYYHRTFRIGRAAEGRRGVYHVTTAGGGAPLYETRAEIYSAVARSSHHHMVLDIDGPLLKGVAIDLEGAVIDSFSIDRSRPDLSPMVSYEMILWDRALSSSLASLAPVRIEGSREAREISLRLPAPPFPSSSLSARWMGGASAWSAPQAAPLLSSEADGTLGVLARIEGERAALYPLPLLQLLATRAFAAGVEVRNAQLEAPVVRWTAHHRLRVSRVTGAISVDGRLDEPAWASAASLDGFTRDGGRVQSVFEEALLGYDDVGLLWGARVRASEGADLGAGASRRDAAEVLDKDDSVACILVAPTSLPFSCLFACNSRGTRLDSLHGRTEWDPVWEVEATTTEGGWEVEARIPWRSLWLKGPSHDPWTVNVIRHDSKAGGYAEWAPTFSAQGRERVHDAVLEFER